jgi:periplasmic protein TonB
MKKNKSNFRLIVQNYLLIPMICSLFSLICCTNEEKPNSRQADSISSKINDVQSSPSCKEKKERINDSLEGCIDPEPNQVKPEFPGGDEKVLQYIAENTIYPEQVKGTGIQGKVFVRFKVCKTGKIGQTTIMKSLNPFLDKEAIRVVKSMPQWKPGLLDGKPVDVWFIIPVLFKLDK